MATLIGTTDTTGGSNDFFGPGDASGTKYTATASGTATDMLMAVRTNSATIKLAIYAADGAAGQQGTLLGQTASFTSTTGSPAVVTAPLLASVSIVNGTAYWLMMIDTHASQNLNMTGGILNGGYDGHNIGNGAAWPDPWDNTGDGGDGTIGMPIRVDGTLGGATEIPMLVMAPPIPA